MKFNFPENTKREKFVNIGFTLNIYNELKAIAEERHITVLDVIRTFIEASLAEYKAQPVVLPKDDTDSKKLVASKAEHSEFTDEQIIKGVRDLEAKALAIDIAEGESKSVEIEVVNLFAKEPAKTFPLPNATPKKPHNSKRSDFNAAGSYASLHDNLKIDYQYCQNPACISNGKFVKGTGFQVEDLIFCKRACYDKWRQ